ncbi:MAG: sigma-54-dependent Fis family transcriptional regulator [Desulfobacteraceae bacterium]|nr:sigma-54-dependent Fis family transcriptional regulator [Desulfobacteraceae bacterium]
MNRPSILIVDDERANLNILISALEADSEIKIAKNGKQALERAVSLQPDLILLDIKMPGLDGYQVCEKLKADERTTGIPVIFISGLDETFDKVKAFQKGGVDYISKPFQPGEVRARVRVQLDLKKTRDLLLQAVREKEEANLLQRIIFASVQDAIITVDENLRILNSNKKLGEICCRADENKLFLFEENPDSGLCPCNEVIRRTLAGQHPVSEYRARCNCRMHGPRTMVLNASPINDPENRFKGVVLVIRDISRLAQLEKDLFERSRFHNIVGKSKKMQKIFSLLEQMADMEFNALITGDSGTGKELIADAIHYGSSRSNGPLIKVNCAALSDNLLESELFGHVRGAFTGAVRDREGRIQAAEGGILFLDEIGDVSPNMQLRLLRFLEAKEYERVGESNTRIANVRVVAATNCDLQEKIRKGEFRKDLYYRLMGLNFHLPLLRDRVEDIPLLCDFFIRQFQKSHNKNISGVAEPVLKRFLEHSWPGNVRELKSTLEFACALCPGELIREEHLPAYFMDAVAERLSQEPLPASAAEGGDSEKTVIIQTLDRIDWNKAKAARLLGISRATLYNKLKRYGITGKGAENKGVTLLQD